MRRDRRVTLATISRRAGVSVATVSKVLNGRPDVAPATRRRVMGLLEASGYVGRPVGRSDPAARAFVDLLMIDLDDPWAARVLSEFEWAARRHGLHIVPSVSWMRSASDTLIDHIVSGGSRGVIAVFADLSAAQRRRLDDAGVPFVAVGAGAPHPATRAVTIDFRAAVRAATEHLIARGHERIGLVNGTRGLDYSDQRLMGYLDAMRRAGAVPDPGLVRHGRFDAEVARLETRALLDLDPPPTAIIAGSDTMAIGTYRAAAEVGLSIGSDLAVVGFDDRPEASWMDPPLTTVRIPVDRLAAAAIEVMLEPVPPVDRSPSIAGTLVIRASSSAPTRAINSVDSRQGPG